MSTFSLAFVASATRSQEQFSLVLGEDTLFHGKSIVVGSTSDLEDTAFKSSTEFIAFDLITEFVVDEFLPESLVFELLFDLSSILRVSNVKDHS